jgi:hypothetical protein
MPNLAHLPRGCLLVSLLLMCAGASPDVSFDSRQGELTLKIDGEPAATYVYQDRTITRPYFCNVRGPSGVPLTRTHPPAAGRDPADHADMHPGMWLAFADISGADVWRNKAAVRHLRFSQMPSGGAGSGSFAVINQYVAGEKVICEETCRYTLRVGPSGYLLIADSTFRSEHEDLSFGDQEEMGFGVRLATPLTVKAGGRIIDDRGRRNEAGIWGKRAAWVDYSGVVDGTRAGVMLMPDPANVRPSRFHVRDYGLMVANPFGAKVFGEQKESRVVIPRGKDLRLRFGLLLHAMPAEREPDYKAAYAQCLAAFAEAVKD